MNKDEILNNLSRVAKKLDRFPTHRDLKELGENKLRHSVKNSTICLTNYAKELSYEVKFTPKGYWTEDKLLNEYKNIVEENDGWPHADIFSGKYGFIIQATYRHGLTPTYFREKFDAIKPADYVEVKCINCDKIFIPSGSNWKRQRFCSDNCKIDYYRIRQNERNAVRIKQSKNCAICGVEFIPKTTTKQKYCERRCFVNFRKRMDKAVRRCLKTFGTTKSTTSSNLLGYNAEELLEHLQKHSDWELVKNKDWHLDHIYPIKAFIDSGIDDIRLICCLDNLQPILEKDNLIKGCKYDRHAFEKWLNIHR